MNTKIHLSIVSPNNPILRKKALSIPLRKIQSPEIQKLIAGLLHIAYGEQRDAKKPVPVGLAAPQVGISKRIILVDVGADGHGGVSDLRLYINPKIVKKSRRREEWYEGCFSTDRVCGIVCRPQAVTVEAFTREGEYVRENHSGYVARIFQHEIDHLNGIEFVTHVSDPNNLHWVEKHEFPEYRNNEVWRTWKKLCPVKKWERIKYKPFYKVKPGKYTHSKSGKLYAVIGTALHSETLEEIVIYQPLYEGAMSKLWVRPAGMFEEKVVVKGKITNRFVRVDSLVSNR